MSKRPFEQSLTIQDLQEWAEGQPAGETLGWTYDGQSCPIAHAVRDLYLDPSEVENTYWVDVHAMIEICHIDGGFELPANFDVEQLTRLIDRLLMDENEDDRSLEVSREDFLRALKRYQEARALIWL